MACVPLVDPTCNPVTAVITDSVTAIFAQISELTAETAGWAVKTLVTGWLMAPSPIMDNQDVVNNLRRYTYWMVGAIAVAALLVAASRMVFGGNGKAGADAAAGLGKLVLVSSLVVPTTIALTEFGDAYARWIITASVGDGLDERVATFAPAATMPGITQLAVIGTGFFLTLVSVLQMLISIAVGGLKILLCGLAPLPAAASITGTGKATLARYLTWLAAAAAYKPAAATIYAGAFWLTGTGDSFETVLTGIVIVTGAVVAMPALLRLFAPIASQVTGSGGGAVGATIAGGLGAVATGAVQLQSARGGQSGGHTGGGPARTAPGGGTGTGARPVPPPGIGPGRSGPPPDSSLPVPVRPGGGPGSAGAGAGQGLATTGGPGRSGAVAPATGGGAAAGTGAAAGGGAATGSGAAAGGGGAAAGSGAAGAAAGAGPAGAAIAAGTAVARTGPAVVKKVGGIADGAAEVGEQ